MESTHPKDPIDGSNISKQRRLQRTVLPSLITKVTADAVKGDTRDQSGSRRTIKDRKLRASLKALEHKYNDAIARAEGAKLLLENEPGSLEAEGSLERSYNVVQEFIKRDVAIDVAKKAFDLKLENFGPYVAEYTRNGRELLLAGRKGHLATVEWREGKLISEVQLGETVRDITWLHNNQAFAAAQKTHVHIYDRACVELHRLQKHVDVTNMEFLPYHFLLATIGNPGFLRYTDTSTGEMVTEIPTKQGPPTALSQNPTNAILHVGHRNGTVTLWSPNSTTPLVKLLAHRGPVRALAIDRGGNYMVSAGQDLRMAVWDVRNYKEVNNYFLRQPASSIAISDRGLTAVSWGTQISIWKGLHEQAFEEQIKIQSPFMTWGGDGRAVERVKWCPFEDILGISHKTGFSSIIVPGAGEPNFDAFELNPYESTRQRREGEVKALLNKLQPEMISIDPNFVGNLNLVSAKRRSLVADEDRKARDMVAKFKARSRGKNSSLRKYLRKKGSRNIVDEKELRLEKLLKEGKGESGNKRPGKQDLGPALARFS